MLLDQDQPRANGLPLEFRLDLAIGGNRLGSAIAAEDVGPSIGRVAQNSQHAAMDELAPEELAVPNATISTPRKGQAVLLKVPHHAIGAARLPEEGEYQADRILNFDIRIQQHAARIISIDITYRQRKTQFAALGLVAFAALEARADKVQFGLRHGAFEPEQKLVVEIGRIVTAIGIDDERAGQGADFQQAMPIAARAR